MFKPDKAESLFGQGYKVMQVSSMNDHIRKLCVINIDAIEDFFRMPIGCVFTLALRSATNQQIVTFELTQKLVKVYRPIDTKTTLQELTVNHLNDTGIC